MLVGRNCENGVYITRVDRNSNNIEYKITIKAFLTKSLFRKLIAILDCFIFLFSLVRLKDIRIQLVKKDQLNNRLSQLKQLKIDDPFLGDSNFRFN